MKPFTERRLLLSLAGVQFTHILDFMIMMPLGPQLMREFGITPLQFSSLVSVYTIGAGVAGLCLAPYVDRFDRRVLLLWTYGGFILGTLACGLAESYHMLLAARVLCGAFGGVAGSVVLTVVGDVVPAERRASGMAVIMTAFAVASALGVPLGLFAAQRLQWQAPFLALAAMTAILWVLLRAGMPPVRGHLDGAPHGMKAFMDLLRNKNAVRALLFMTALVGGHFAIIPFMPAYLVGNVKLPEESLFMVYLLGGVLTVFTSPVVGRLADRLGRFQVFAVLVGVACLITLAITNAGPLPSWGALVLTSMFFVFASGRFGPAQAIMTLAVPQRQRGSLMSLSAFARDLASGVTSALGGWVVAKGPGGQLLHYNWLGWMAVAASLGSVWLVARVKAAPEK